ncbi:hypothetical protein NYR68_08525 [Actinobacillus equuli subsp. haemolyticus]|uniref:hypothetical protein n=1 Tax=Actinobacillus equuli TaxID=718 RepID=UPI0024466E57|nr:hypothetical protein [Actinobacillus equuli]WGE50309.1 hypothetical protein NYR68_08525 [Actinobacillus equuli subsp. haemolyticus]
MKIEKPTLYEGLKKIKDLNIINENIDNDSILGTFSYNDLIFTFLDRMDNGKDYNIFVISLELEFDFPKKGKKTDEFKKDFEKYFKSEISSIAGVSSSYKINRDSVKINMLSITPYINVISNSEMLITPIINIMYFLHLDLYRFFLDEV